MIETGKRRTFLKLGLAATVTLSIASGVAWLAKPGLKAGKMSTEARNVFRAVALAVLDGSLPIESGEQTKALEALLGRIDDLMSALPQHTQVELSQLLGLLATSAGRLALVGLNDHWSLAPVPDVQTALQSMRTSRLAVKRQTYAALRDIAASAYVSVPEVWPQLGYPGPIAIS